MKRFAIAIFLLSLAAGAVLIGQTGTLAPAPYQVLFDSNGDPIVAGKICTYVAGSSTPATTYQDSALGSANTNPIVTDTSGRWRAFLVPGQSYKFVFYSNDGTANTCDGTILRTQDNIGAVPTSANNIDVSGTAGEALTAGQVVYLSDGSNSKTAGSWYLADADFSYASTNTLIGVAPAAIASMGTGVIRLSGTVTGLSGLVTGTDYFVSTTAGNLTASPSGNMRFVGRADTTTSLVITANPSSPPVADQVCGRLTLTSTIPVTTTDVSSATTVYYAPYNCNIISLYDSTRGVWNNRTFSQLSAVVPSTANTNYDVFIYDNAGTPTIEVSSAWTSRTAIFASGTYATSRPTQDGRWVKSTNGTTVDATRRYIGSFATETASGMTDDTGRLRLVFNAFNRVRRSLVWNPTTASWTQATTTPRQANNDPLNQIEVVRGLDEDAPNVRLYGAATASASTPTAAVAFGLDSTTSVSSSQVVIQARQPTDNGYQPIAEWNAAVGLGWHRLVWLEMTDAAGGSTITWYGRRSGNEVETGMSGSITQ